MQRVASSYSTTHPDNPLILSSLLCPHLTLHLNNRSRPHSARKHRARAAQGSAIRHPATHAGRGALLTTPYAQLNKSQRRRVQRYRQQSRCQAELSSGVAANLQVQGIHISDIQLSTQSQQPVAHTGSQTHIHQQAQIVAS